MMPLWIGVLGERFLHGDLVQDSSSHDQHAKIQVPYGRIITSLLILIVPLLVGVAIARFKPQLGAQLRKALINFFFIIKFLDSSAVHHLLADLSDRVRYLVESVHVPVDECAGGFCVSWTILLQLTINFS